MYLFLNQNIINCKFWITTLWLWWIWLKWYNQMLQHNLYDCFWARRLQQIFFGDNFAARFILWLITHLFLKQDLTEELDLWLLISNLLKGWESICSFNLFQPLDFLIICSCFHLWQLLIDSKLIEGIFIWEETQPTLGLLRFSLSWWF